MIGLGLIGDNIKPSRAPRLHREAGRLAGLDVSYELLIPGELGKDFDRVFEDCRASGMRGLNITYPYKQIAVARAEIDDPLVRRLGAINTVVFEGGRARGYNTDHSGFIAAWRAAFGSATPGRAVIVGAGGAGRAVAFGLAALGAGELTIVDTDIARAEALAQALGGLAATVKVRDAADAEIRAAEGIVNCTPVGMVGYPGSPIDVSLLGPQRWAFEAVYTPRQTEFSLAAAAAGLDVIGGYELFIHQGLDAFRLFTGRVVDEQALRAALAE
ncbi:shikimate dehydrogenase [Mesorhizobium sp. KR9-304]|uniref:shikimate dehydrogenase family protein n=1 Tax=Mesorhizobium sp. KR9-304 TaxID=3156614 RepID=UPI0032B61A94